MMKRVFAIVCAVLVMACAIVPCFASNWYEETPEYGGQYSGVAYEYPFLSIQLQVREVVEKAYQLGLFGGAKPVFVAYYFPGGSASMRVVVGVPRSTAGNSIAQDGYPKDGAYSWGLITPATNGRLVITTSSGSYTPWALYQLSSNGDWSPVTTYTGSTSSYLQLSSSSPGTSTAQYKYVASWRNGAWSQPAGATATFATGWDESSAPTDATLTSIIARYDRAIMGTVEELPDPEPSRPIYNYELDIARIFDGMFNGVRSILSGFDINLFGISIVGMLVAFIVIAVVAFIVRKLWK